MWKIIKQYFIDNPEQLIVTQMAANFLAIIALLIVIILLGVFK